MHQTYWPGVVNGNGNALIGYAVSTPYGGAETANNAHGYENFAFWVHLSKAGLVEGTYSGVAGPNGGDNAVAGNNIPYAKYKSAVWCMSDPRYGWRLTRDWSNMMTFAGVPNQTGVYDSDKTCGAPILIPEDAFLIDQKMDDGKPATGTVAGGQSTHCTNVWTDVANPNASYSLGNREQVCWLSFKLFN